MSVPFEDGVPEMAPKPPTCSSRPGAAGARLGCAPAPEWPQTPDARRTPARPGRASVARLPQSGPQNPDARRTPAQPGFWGHSGLSAPRLTPGRSWAFLEMGGVFADD